MSSIILLSSAALNKNKSVSTLNGIDINSYEFLDGTVSQYLVGVSLERPTGSSITNSTTQYSGWDIFYEPDNRIWGIHAKASKAPESGEIGAAIHFIASPQKYHHATESWDITPVKPTIGSLRCSRFVQIVGRFGQSCCH